MGYNDSQGSKYDPKMSRDEMKARILADLKMAVESGELPPCKPTLRCRDYNSITITLREFAGPLFLVDAIGHEVEACAEPRVSTLDYSGVGRSYATRYTREAIRAITTAEAIADEYNYDRSDTQTDYFDVHFYLTVRFDEKQEAAEKAAIMAGASPKRAALAKEVASHCMVVRDQLIDGGRPEAAKSFMGITACANKSAAEWTAARIAKESPALGSALRTFIGKTFAAPEDWNTAAGEDAQAALYAPKSKRVVIGIPMGGGTPPTPGAEIVRAETVGKLSPAQKAWATRRARAAAGKAVVS